ncbi:MAG TPA: hypothetical protein VFF27_05665 [Bacteroidia bacterium]|jgi:hypothetical protein|nr:hypothetical protein [Bacteroidia bacterium]
MNNVLLLISFIFLLFFSKKEKIAQEQETQIEREFLCQKWFLKKIDEPDFSKDGLIFSESFKYIHKEYSTDSLMQETLILRPDSSYALYWRDTI